MGDDLFKGFLFVVSGRLEKLIKVSLGPSFIKSHLFFLQIVPELIDLFVLFFYILNAALVNKPFDLIPDDHLVVVFLLQFAVSIGQI